MKTKVKILNTILGASMLITALMAALFSTGCASNSPNSEMAPMKGGEHMMMLQGINSTQEVEALKPDDSVAMVCSKCQTVWVTRPRQGMKGGEILNERGRLSDVIGTHACKGCGSTLTVTGHAKGDITELVHSCKVCGDSSAFCCATKSVGAATKGMEKN